MCFAPQRRTIFPDRNFQNVSDNFNFWTFWHTNVLRVTAACDFSTLPSTATSAPAALASLLFEHQEPRFIEKTQRFATFLTFGACVSSFLCLFSCDCYPAFQLSILSEVRLVNFLRILQILIFTCNIGHFDCFWIHSNSSHSGIAQHRPSFSKRHLVWKKHLSYKLR